LAIALALAEPEARRKEKGSPDDNSGISHQKKTNGKRHERVFSIFNIVNFKNEGCRSSSTISSSTGSQFRNGTCYTQSECNSRAGTAAGSCASGFGVCCVFLISESGSAVTQNCSYIRNPNFPNTYDSNNGGAVTYTIQKCSNDVCSLRLDFESFTIVGTGLTTEVDGPPCMDTFDITTNTNQPIPQICGQNSGQHIYAEIGAAAADTAQLSFQFTGTSTNRIWEIKVTQIPCASNYRQPDGCLQYHTGLTGRFSTFNFLDSSDNHLRSQEYSVCIRQERGYCCVEYSPCSDTRSFSLGTTTAIAQIDSECSQDWIGISASGANCIQGSTNVFHNKYCGNIFNAHIGATLNAPVCDCTAPFIIDVRTDTVSDIAAGANTANAAAMESRGVCLEWRQIPCQ